MRNFFYLFCSFLLLAACAPRGVLLSPVKDLPGQSSLRQIYVASNRGRLIENGVQLTSERSETMSFSRLDISIPLSHQPGRIEWPGNQDPDPNRHFVLNKAQPISSRAAFLSALSAAERGTEEVILFVHGFNVNNAEAAFRLAQIAHDFEAVVPVISFSWPSEGKANGYVYDRDSAIYSRDALEYLLLDLTANNRKVLLVGHSMGSQLVMEVLRQMSIGGQGNALRSLSGVALISPDIDPEVFVGQARRITPFPEPFMLLVSARDWILGISAWLAGSPRRLGEITSKDVLDGLPVQIVDLTEFTKNRAGGHDTAFSAPAAIKLLRGLSP